jgi:hypothetical protein
MWRGIGTTPDGDASIELTVLINEDGSGEYTFDQYGYHESFPFTISHDDHSFSVDIPETSDLGQVSGTWEFAAGKLVLDIASLLASGSTFSYTAVCEKD